MSQSCPYSDSNCPKVETVKDILKDMNTKIEKIQEDLQDFRVDNEKRFTHLETNNKNLVTGVTIILGIFAVIVAFF